MIALLDFRTCVLDPGTRWYHNAQPKITTSTRRSWTGPRNSCKIFPHFRPTVCTQTSRRPQAGCRSKEKKAFPSFGTGSSAMADIQWLNAARILFTGTQPLFSSLIVQPIGVPWSRPYSSEALSARCWIMLVGGFFLPSFTLVNILLLWSANRCTEICSVLSFLNINSCRSISVCVCVFVCFI